MAQSTTQRQQHMWRAEGFRFENFYQYRLTCMYKLAILAYPPGFMREMNLKYI